MVLNDDTHQPEELAFAASATAGNPFLRNPQLKDWTDAKSRYFELRNRQSDWTDYRQIINLLGASLSALLGANYANSDPRTPGLAEFLTTVLPRDNGWNLEKDKPKLFSEFFDFNNIYNNTTKHFQRSKHVDAKTLTLKALSKHMSTVQSVWIWVLEKRAQNGDIPSDQLVEFRETFDLE